MAIETALIKRGTRGKIGGVTYYQQDGQTLSRQANTERENTPSAAQLVQRIRMLNLLNFYKANKEWASSTFPNRPVLLNDPAEFNRLNMMRNAVALTKEEYLEGYSIPSDYYVSHGVLPSVSYFKYGSRQRSSVEVAWQADGNITTLRYWYEVWGSAVSDTPGNSIRLQEGDRVTWVAMEFQTLHTGAPAVLVPYVCSRVVDPNDTDPIPDFPGKCWKSAGVRTPGIVLGTFSDTTHDYPFNFVAGFVFIERRTRRGFQYSTEKLSVLPTSFIAGFSTIEHWQAAMDSYGITLDSTHHKVPGKYGSFYWPLPLTSAALMGFALTTGPSTSLSGYEVQDNFLQDFDTLMLWTTTGVNFLSILLNCTGIYEGSGSSANCFVYLQFEDGTQEYFTEDIERAENIDGLYDVYIVPKEKWQSLPADVKRKRIVGITMRFDSVNGKPLTLKAL